MIEVGSIVFAPICDELNIRRILIQFPGSVFESHGICHRNRVSNNTTEIYRPPNVWTRCPIDVTPSDFSRPAYVTCSGNNNEVTGRQSAVKPKRTHFSDQLCNSLDLDQTVRLVQFQTTT